MNFFKCDRQTESDSYEPNVQYAQVGSKSVIKGLLFQKAECISRFYNFMKEQINIKIKSCLSREILQILIGEPCLWDQ